MTKKLIFTVVMLALATANIHGQHLLPSSVRQYLNERMLGEQATGMSRFAASHMIDGQEMIDCFIAMDDARAIAHLQQAGVVVGCQFDGFITAQVPVSQLEQISTLAGVKNVEVSARLPLCTDSTMRATHVIDVMNGLSHHLPYNYDGSGVIVGIIDVGFDYRHLAFRCAEDTSRCRIVRVYDTSDKSGHTARYKQAILSGSVFFNDEVLGLTTDDESATHGTHTASIAAGTHVGGYGGMAPGADIVLCAVSQMGTGLSAVEVANCVRYIDCYADSVGKPYVISVSVSTSDGPHDGKDYLSKAIAQIVGPGNIFVIAAGNNGDNPTYATGHVAAGEPFNFLLMQKSGAGYDSTYLYEDFLADVWMRNEWTRFDYKFHILDLNTNQIVWVSAEDVKTMSVDLNEIAEYYGKVSGATSCYLKGTVETSSDGKRYHITVQARNLESKKYTLSASGNTKYSQYAIGLTLRPRKDTYLDAWVSNSDARFAQYTEPVTLPDGTPMAGTYTASNSDCSIGTYAVHDSIISAGAYIARNSYYSLKQNKIVSAPAMTIGQITNFSSYAIEGSGPTGKALPTVCAPGYNVVAAGSRYSTYAYNSNYTVMRTDDGSPWCVMGGTSMASPTVAGIIALWLQADPKLSVRQVKDIIAQTAIRDRFTNGSMGTHFGPNGKIDALAGMQLILERQHYGTGDVNNDGNVTIEDVTTLIDYLLSGRVEVFNAKAADVNFDGDINISDLTDIIDMLLAQ